MDAITRATKGESMSKYGCLIILFILARLLFMIILHFIEEWQFEHFSTETTVADVMYAIFGIFLIICTAGALISGLVFIVLGFIEVWKMF